MNNIADVSDIPFKARSEPLFLTVKGAATRLGISRQAIYELLRAGELPSTTIGRKRLILRSDLEQFAQRRVDTKFVQVEDHQRHPARRSGGTR